MKTKFQLVCLVILGLFKTMYSQEYCYVNNGLKFQETVSFEIKGNVVVQKIIFSMEKKLEIRLQLHLLTPFLTLYQIKQSKQFGL